MSLIKIYTENNNQQNNELLEKLKNKNIDFLEYKLNEGDLEKYNLEKLPAIEFDKNFLYNIDDKIIDETVENFETYIEKFQKSKSNDTETKSIKNLKTQILVNTIKISNKDNIRQYIDKFKVKYIT